MAADRDRAPKRRETRGSAGDADGQRINVTLQELQKRSKATLVDRVHRVRLAWILAVQAGLAAALAWVVAHELLGNPEPVFAPISAVSTLAASVGQRFRRTVELIIGVAVGVLVGDGLLVVVGTGPWQLGLIVTLSIITTIFFGGSVAVVTQAAATAVLIATLSPSVKDLEFPRFVDAFVGGGIALLVTAVLLPLNPLRVINRAARPALDLLADQLSEVAAALANRDAGRAHNALLRLRDNKEELTGFFEAIDGAKETTTLSPARWHRRGELAHYVEAADPVERAMRNSGTLIRRSVTLIEDNEPIPKSLPDGVSHLAEAVRLMRHEFGAGLEPEGARERSLRAVSEISRAYAEGVGFSGSVVVAQVRTTASDLLVATGVEQDDANQLIRRAFGGREPPVAAPPPEREPPPEPPPAPLA